MSEPTNSPVALREARERTIRTLIDHFALDHLEVGDFERRLDQAHQATSLPDLQALVSDLPAAADAAGVPAAPQPARTTLPDGVQQRNSQLVVGIMGGATRRGRWVPAHNNTAIGMMGGVLLDFREALLPPGETRVHAFAFWGGVSIVVPPDLDVTVDGVGIMGGFDHLGQSRALPAPDAPRLRIDGVAIMGGVDVQVKGPHEPTAWDPRGAAAMPRHEGHRQMHMQKQELRERRQQLKEEARRLKDEWRGRR